MLEQKAHGLGVRLVFGLIGQMPRGVVGLLSFHAGVVALFAVRSEDFRSQNRKTNMS
jgi:hypothetical protein